MKLIFLDRDGVINEFPGLGNYVLSLSDFKFIPGSEEAIALLTRAGYEINVTSNQACVAKGFMTEEALQKITDRMLQKVAESNGKITGVFYCPHEESDDCECRKPKPGLLEKALAGRKINRDTAYFIGDTEMDVQAGRSFGCKTILVLSGRSKKDDVAGFKVKPDIIKNNLLEAAEWLIQKK